MSSEAEMPLPRRVATPVKSAGWRVWDRLVEAGALVVALPLLPFIIFGRAFQRLGQRYRLAQQRDVCEVQNYQLELSASRPVEFLKIYLDQIYEMEQLYLTTPWQSLAEAQAGANLLEAARAALLAQALAEVQASHHR
jgi:hypothetical protein